MLGIGLECPEKVKLWNKKLCKLFGIKLWERVRQLYYLLKVRCILGILHWKVSFLASMVIVLQRMRHLMSISRNLSMKEGSLFC